MTAAKKARRISLKAAISLAAVIVSGGIAATPADAQLLGACPSIIQPPPCIIFDYKKLANWAQTHAQVLQQIQTIKQQIDQTKATISTVGQLASNLTSINFQMPNLDLNPSSIFGNTLAGISDIGQSYAGKVFASSAKSNTLDGQTEAGNQVLAANMDADVDAYAQRIYADDQIGKSENDIKSLNDEVNNADTLQADWVANSHVRLAIVAAMTQRSYLLTTYLKMQAAHGTRQTDIAITGGGGGGIISTAAATPLNDTITPLIDQLHDLLSQASSLMASVQVVQLAQANIAQLQAEITDYNNTVAANAALNAKFQSDAQGWSSHHWQQIVGDTNTAMANKDIEYANDRATDIDSSVNTYQFGRRGINPADFTGNEVDPRQFLGTWSDPIKGTLAREISDYLTSGSLDDYLSGDENDQFRNDVIGYMSGGNYVDGLYSLREEVAWKKQIVDGDPNDPTNPSVQSQIDAANTTISDENAKLQKQFGIDATTDAITAQLTDIVNKANAIGQQVAASGNAPAQQQASQTLAQLQQVVGNGTGLPAVDPTSVISTDASGNDTVVAGSTDLTQYPTTPAPTTTTDGNGDTIDIMNPRSGIQP